MLSVRVVAWQLLLQAEAEAPLPIAERVRTALGPSFRVNSLRLSKLTAKLCLVRRRIAGFVRRKCRRVVAPRHSAAVD